MSFILKELSGDVRGVGFLLTCSPSAGSKTFEALGDSIATNYEKPGSLNYYME